MLKSKYRKEAAQMAQIMAQMPRIRRAIMVRPQSPETGPQKGVLQIVLYHEDGTPLLPKVEGGVRVELHFVDGLGSEVWKETRRRVALKTVLTLYIAACRKEPSLGSALLPTCANPKILRSSIRGFTLSVPGMPDLRFRHDPHPESTLFLQETQDSEKEQP